MVDDIPFKVSGTLTASSWVRLEVHQLVDMVWLALRPIKPGLWRYSRLFEGGKVTCYLHCARSLWAKYILLLLLFFHCYNLGSSSFLRSPSFLRPSSFLRSWNYSNLSSLFGLFSVFSHIKISWVWHCSAKVNNLSVALLSQALALLVIMSNLNSTWNGWESRQIPE